MMRSALYVANAFLVATLAVVSAGWPTHALSPEEQRSSTRSAPAASSPLLDALAFASPDTIYFEFTDWTVLKALHDGSDITSASPLEDRQRLVLDMVHAEASRFDFGLDRLATWPELWGWDNTDLAWEATWFPFDVRVLALPRRLGRGAVHRPARSARLLADRRPQRQPLQRPSRLQRWP